jgi:diketogulonate reductase-like aldo/keto reductase
MKHRRFGWTGVQVPVIGQGTWQMEQDDRDACIASLKRGLDAGMTHIDTAELYGHGHVESEIVAPAIAGRRDEVFLVSKVLPWNATYDGTLEACERSLRRLRTDRLDCYLLHWPGQHPLEQTIRAFEKLVQDGKIRFYGVSNFDAHEIDDAIRIAGPKRIACNQVLYHLKERAIEHAVMPTCERHEIAAVAYSPFGSGDFPTKNRVLADIAAAHRTTPHAAALAFLCRRDSTLAIPKTTVPEHAAQNAAAGDLTLSKDELAQLDAAFPLGRARGLPTL